MNKFITGVRVVPESYFSIPATSECKKNPINSITAGRVSGINTMSYSKFDIVPTFDSKEFFPP